MKKLCVIIAIICCLVGCADGVASPIELVKKPRVPVDRSFPRDRINQLIPQGSKLIRPLQSNDLTSINYFNWDADDANEVYAFYKDSARRRVGVVLLDRANGEWRDIDVVDSSAADIEYAQFVDYNGDGVKDIVLGLTMPGELYSVLLIYQWQDNQYVEAYRDVYTHITVADIDQSGIVDILTVRLDRNREALASLISYRDGYYQVVSELALDEFILGYYNIVFGYANDQQRGLFIDMRIGSEYNTNVVIYRDGQLTLAFDEQAASTLRAKLTRTQQIASSDINGDGIIEIGNRLPSPLYRNSSGDIAYFNTWYQWNGKRALDLVYMTYINDVDRYELIIPTRWSDAVGRRQLAILDARDDAKFRFMDVYFTARPDELYKLMTIERVPVETLDAKLDELSTNQVTYYVLAERENSFYIAYLQGNRQVIPEPYRRQYENLVLTEAELRMSFRLVE